MAKARSDQLRRHVVYVARTSIGVFSELSTKIVPPPDQFSALNESPREGSTSGPSPRRVTFAEPISQTKAVEDIDDDGDDDENDVVDATPGSPMEDDNDEPVPGPSRPMTREEKVAQNPFYDSEDDDGKRRSTKLERPRPTWGGLIPDFILCVSACSDPRTPQRRTPWESPARTAATAQQAKPKTRRTIHPHIQKGSI